MFATFFVFPSDIATIFLIFMPQPTLSYVPAHMFDRQQVVSGGDSVEEKTASEKRQCVYVCFFCSLSK